VFWLGGAAHRWRGERVGGRGRAGEAKTCWTKAPAEDASRVGRRSSVTGRARCRRRGRCSVGADFYVVRTVMPSWRRERKRSPPSWRQISGDNFWSGRLGATGWSASLHSTKLNPDGGFGLRHGYLASLRAAMRKKSFTFVLRLSLSPYPTVYQAQEKWLGPPSTPLPAPIWPEWEGRLKPAGTLRFFLWPSLALLYFGL
jgi:hypothetical protein